MHPVDPITWAYGLFGAALFGASWRRWDVRSMGYGALAVLSWVANVNSAIWLGPEVTTYVMVVFDFALAMVLAVELTSDPDPRGIDILSLFALEMAAQICFAVSGYWGSTESQIVLNLIWAAIALIGGGRNALEIVTHWSGRSRARARVLAGGS